jgi:radical SAM protein with 4Fe4S-binding SPASM domain
MASLQTIPRQHHIAVWEFTLACNLKCRHCGSSAGKQRANELTTQKALDVVYKLHDLGVKEVNLIGGEATLRSDWNIIGKAITDAGMLLGFQTGGLHINKDIIDRMQDLGTNSFGVSIDGFREVHDSQRGVRGSFDKAINALELASESKIPTIACTTQLNRQSYKSILLLLERVSSTRVKSWQIAPTLPMGIGSSAKDLHLQPADFVVLHELAAIFAIESARRGIFGIAANPLGYFGPYERLMRSGAENINKLYSGCPAGNGVIGIEADGTVKGCPSLPTNPYALGKSYADGFDQLNTLWKKEKSPYHRKVYGFCAKCPFQEFCWSGCGWSSTTTLGEKGNNPYCMFRAIVYESRNMHEKLTQAKTGNLGPFEYGTFALTEKAGKSTDKIMMSEVHIPISMEETCFAFQQKRNDVLHSCAEVFDSYTKSEIRNPAHSLAAFAVMEKLSLPLQILSKWGFPKTAVHQNKG